MNNVRKFVLLWRAVPSVAQIIAWEEEVSYSQAHRDGYIHHIMSGAWTHTLTASILRQTPFAVSRSWSLDCGGSKK
jgi:hypothetical protein